MPRGPKGEKRPADVIGNAVHGVQQVEDRLAWIIPGTGLVGDPPVIVGPAQR